MTTEAHETTPRTFTLEAALASFDDLRVGDVLTQVEPHPWHVGADHVRVLGTLYMAPETHDGETFIGYGTDEGMPVWASRETLSRWIAEIADWRVKDAETHVRDAQRDAGDALAKLATAIAHRDALVGV